MDLTLVESVPLSISVVGNPSSVVKTDINNKLITGLVGISDLELSLPELLCRILLLYFESTPV